LRLSLLIQEEFFIELNLFLGVIHYK